MTHAADFTYPSAPPESPDLSAGVLPSRTITDPVRFAQRAAQEASLGKSGLNPKVYLPSIIKIKLEWEYFKKKSLNGSMVLFLV